MIYEIKKGQTDWRPRDRLLLLTGFDSLTWTVTPDKSMEFDYIDPITDKIDADWNDWKKIGGISLVNWRNPWNAVMKDRDAIMLAWRWNPVYNFHEFAVYTNSRGKKIAYERPDQVLRTIAGTRVSMQITRVTRRNYRVRLYVTSQGPDSVNAFEIKTRQAFGLYSLIGPWYGGKNNSPGPWGGAAPKDMTMNVELERM